METLLKIKCPDKSEYTGTPDGDIWADDISKKRKSQADALLNLVVAQDYSCTIGLNGGWGSGKTFFLTRFVADYRKEVADGAKHKPSAIYFNAWKDDFLSDPLLSVLGQIMRADGLQKFKVILEEVNSAVKPLLIKTGFELSKCIAKGLVEKATGVNVDELAKAANVSPEGFRLLEEKDLLTSYKEFCKSRDVLREKLEKLSQANWNLTHRPLVIVIDELDRCRPIFAIELLERIKHLFNVPHLVFVIGMDADELKKSMKTVYGNINTQDYLLKFIDIETTLPPLTRDDFIASLWHELGYDKLTVLGSRVYEDGDLVFEYFKLLSKINNLTLRQIEQGVRLFAFLARPYRSCKRPMSSGLIAAAIMLKVVNPEMYCRVVDWSFDIWDLLDAVLPMDALVDKTSDVYAIAQEFYKLVCAHNPMGEVRQNLTCYAVKGKIMDGSSGDNFRLPKCVENLPPSDRKEFFKTINDDIATMKYLPSTTGRNYNVELKDQRVPCLKLMRMNTIDVITKAFQIA